MQNFTAKIYRLGINPVVDPPDEVLTEVFRAAGKDKGPIPVHGAIGGADFVQTLVRFQGAWRLYVNGEMLKASGLSVGAEAKIAIEFDPRPRAVPVPRSLAAALDGDKRLRIAFGNLTPSRQNEIFRYIGSLKTQQSIERNVEKILRQLREGIVEKPLAAKRAKAKRG